MLNMCSTIYLLIKYCVSGGIAPLFPDLGPKWKEVFRFMPQPIFPLGKGPQYPFDRKLAKRKIFWPYLDVNSTHPGHYTVWAICNTMSIYRTKLRGKENSYLRLEVVPESNGMYWVWYRKLLPTMIMFSFIVDIIILTWTWVLCQQEWTRT